MCHAVREHTAIVAIAPICVRAVSSSSIHQTMAFQIYATDLLKPEDSLFLLGIDQYTIPPEVPFPGWRSQHACGCHGRNTAKLHLGQESKQFHWEFPPDHLQAYSIVTCPILAAHFGLISVLLRSEEAVSMEKGRKGSADGGANDGMINGTNEGCRGIWSEPLIPPPHRQEDQQGNDGYQCPYLQAGRAVCKIYLVESL